MQDVALNVTGPPSGSQGHVYMQRSWATQSGGAEHKEKPSLSSSLSANFILPFVLRVFFFSQDAKKSLISDGSVNCRRIQKSS
mmetsp:Transcript_104936/g.201414  ORF Transcript_104936/g.201414 Transcript_104936/m.201414 type:complete len:83 (-) Transcript_104936:1-249(-)